MRPKLSLAGLNRLRMAIALLSGGMAAGISFFGRSTTHASAMVDGTLLSALWIYIGVTAVPWANLWGMAGAGVMPALTAVSFGAYLAAATGVAGWTVAENPVWHETPRPAPAPAPRCVSDPASASDAGVAPAIAPVADPPAPAPTPPTPPPPAIAATDASVRAPAPAVVDASVFARDAASDAGAEEPEGRHRRHRHRSDDENDEDDSRPPTAVLERDPAVSN